MCDVGKRLWTIEDMQFQLPGVMPKRGGRIVVRRLWTFFARRR
jgi:hypothetical protein